MEIDSSACPQGAHSFDQKTSTQQHAKNGSCCLGGLYKCWGERPGLLCHRLDLGWVLKPEQASARQSREGGFLHFSLERPGPKHSLLGQGPPSMGPRPTGRGGKGEVSRFKKQGGGGRCRSFFHTGGPAKSNQQPILLHPAWAPRLKAATLSSVQMGEANPHRGLLVLILNLIT